MVSPKLTGKFVIADRNSGTTHKRHSSSCWRPDSLTGLVPVWVVRISVDTDEGERILAPPCGGRGVGDIPLT